MIISEFGKPVTAKSLNESLAKRFGSRIKLENFTLEQLQDARNKIRTKLSQIEMSESFNTVVESDDYQKSKLFLDVLNAEISERGDIEEEALEEKKAKPDFLDVDKDGNKKEPMKKALKDKERVEEGAGVKAVCKDCGDEFGKPTTDCKNDCNDPTLECWVRESEYKKVDEAYKKVPNKDGSGNLMPYRSSDGKCAPGYVLETNRRGMMCVPRASAASTFTKESIVREGAEDQAEIVMAAKEMVDRLTGWMEDVAEMKTESMLELADAIRDEMGSQQSQAWLDTIKPGLEELYAAMEVTRGSLSNGVGMLTGEGEVTPPPTEMGADEMGAEMPADDAAMEPTVDMEAGGDESFATAAPAAGGAEEAGRPARESIERKVKRESIDSRKLATKLASSKKK